MAKLAVKIDSTFQKSIMKYYNAKAMEVKKKCKKTNIETKIKTEKKQLFISVLRYITTNVFQSVYEKLTPHYV